MKLPGYVRTSALIVSTILLLIVLFAQDAIPADFVWMTMVLSWWGIVTITPGGWPRLGEKGPVPALAIDKASHGEPTVGECPHCGEAVLIPAHGSHNTIQCGACGGEIGRVPVETAKSKIGAGRIGLIALVAALALSGSCSLEMKRRSRELLDDFEKQRKEVKLPAPRPAIAPAPTDVSINPPKRAEFPRVAYRSPPATQPTFAPPLAPVRQENVLMLRAPHRVRANPYSNLEHRFAIDFPREWKIMEPVTAETIIKAVLHQNDHLAIITIGSQPWPQGKDFSSFAPDEAVNIFNRAYPGVKMEHIDRGVAQIGEKRAVYITVETPQIGCIARQFQIVHRGRLYLVAATTDQDREFFYRTLPIMQESIATLVFGQ